MSSGSITKREIQRRLDAALAIFKARGVEVAGVRFESDGNPIILTKEAGVSLNGDDPDAIYERWKREEAARRAGGAQGERA